ncbi:YihY/virulence factor BrkB family protein [Williamwhitmania taraxaci]|uniref:Membrane protein n=1 Tax=Williamwhitmania taraxaci TaxID=1640674 RepID=A0A1G6ISA7_9BACT|nr:YihY/virulence factor BrkB family protein [Williamwhitmania taraxaci]SDC09303.1 membrane protein [Williamwhitmania taraxaci]
MYKRFVGYLLGIYYRSTLWAKEVSLPGFYKTPIYDVVVFFFRGIMQGSLTTRASAIAFSFFLAIFPSIIFLFTLIPYIPVDNFQGQFFSMLKALIPGNAFAALESTLLEVITLKSGGLLSFGFVAALFFSTNGVNSLLGAFNATYHRIVIRNIWSQYIVSILLTIFLTFLISLATALIIFGQLALSYLDAHNIIKDGIVIWLLIISKWLIVLILFFFSIAMLYYFAPADRIKFRFFSPGASLATFLIIVTSVGFSAYVNNFGQYNKLYGSIGSFMALMLWLYFNAIALLLGFELNASISSASNDRGDNVDAMIKKLD